VNVLSTEVPRDRGGPARDHAYGKVGRLNWEQKVAPLRFHSRGGECRQCHPHMVGPPKLIAVKTLSCRSLVIARHDLSLKMARWDRLQKYAGQL
jgi:hypothetical protein